MGLFSIWKHKSVQAKLRQLPEIVAIEEPSHYSAVHEQVPKRRVKALTEKGEQVGFVEYEVLPLEGAVWVYKIEVTEAVWRQGYGLALLGYLQEKYMLPLHPVKVLFSAKPFWEAAQKLYEIGKEISMSEVLARTK